MVFNKRASLNGDNEFYTPTWATKMLLSYIDLKDKTVWECASGQGHILHVFAENDIKAFGTDIETGTDFLEGHKGFSFDVIVTNPPFNLKNDFIEKCFKYAKPFCLLLPLSALEGKKRHEMYLKYNKSLDVILPDKRISYINADANPNFTSAWFCFGFRETIAEHKYRLVFRKSEDYI